MVVEQKPEMMGAKRGPKTVVFGGWGGGDEGSDRSARVF